MKLIRSLFSQPPPLKRFFSVGDDFSFEAPANWQRQLHPDYVNIFQVLSPDASVAITVSGYHKKLGMSLREFVDARYGAIDDVFKAVAPEQFLPQVFYREYEGLLSDQDTIPTYYVVSGIETENGFFSLTIVTTRDEFVKNTIRYTHVMSSVQC